MLTAKIFIGIDWGSFEHAVTTVRNDGKIVDFKVFTHTKSGMDGLENFIKELGKYSKEIVAVAIEVPRGPVVEMVLNLEVPLYAINPKQLARFRDRISASGAKDDKRDSFVLANSLRTDPAAFRQVKPPPSIAVQLRELNRFCDSLDQNQNALCNQLWSILNQTIPELLELSSGADDRWLWELIESTSDLRGIAEMKSDDIRLVLKRCRTKRLKPSDITEKAKILTVSDGLEKALSMQARMIVKQVKMIDDQRRTVVAEMDCLLSQYPIEDDETKGAKAFSDSQILLSCVLELVARSRLLSLAKHIIQSKKEILRL